MLLLASFIPCLLQVRRLCVWLSWMNTDGGQRSHVKRSTGLVHPEGVKRVSKVLFIFILFCLSSPPPTCSRDQVAWAGLELRICLLHLLNAGMPGVGHHTQLKYLFAWTKWTLICFFWIALQIMNGMKRIHWMWTDPRETRGASGSGTSQLLHSFDSCSPLSLSASVSSLNNLIPSYSQTLLQRDADRQEIVFHVLLRDEHTSMTTTATTASFGRDGV